MKRPRFSLRMLLFCVFLVGCWGAWVAHRNVEFKQHQEFVSAVTERGGMVDYASGRASANLGALFPQRSWRDILFPPWQRDVVVAVSFQSANQSFGTELPDQDGTHWIDPDWSYESMIKLDEPLESFSALGRLEFSRMPLPRHGLRCIEELPQLKQLLLEQSQITSADVEHLKDLTNLRYLNMRRTRIDNDCLVHLGRMQKLKTLQLGSTRIGDAGVEHLTTLRGLTSLWLDNTPLTDAGLLVLTKLDGLQELRIELTQVTDAGIQKLASMQNLEKLVVGGPNITAEGVSRLQTALPNCQIQHSRR